MGLRTTSSGKILLRGTKMALSPVAAAVSALYTAMIGQSNMVHLGDEIPGTVKYYTTSPSARRSVGGGVHNFIGPCDVTGTIPPWTPFTVWGNQNANLPNNHPSGNGVTSFANATVEQSGGTLLTYEYAKSGTAIQSWMSDYSAGTNNWTPFASAVQADPAGLNSAIWLQGENNSDNTMTVAIYKGYLRRLHDQLLALAGMTAQPQSFYFGIVILGPGTTYGPEGSMGRIRQAQLEYIAENVGAYLAAVATDMNLAGDVIHFDDPSEMRMGLRYAKGLAAWSKGLSIGAQGPKITGAVRTGQQVDVTVQHSGGTSLVDGSGGGGASVLGFRFFDAGAAGANITYTASSITASNKIRLTLASTPVGTLTMDYGMANAPYGGTTSPASVIYDNDIVPHDTIGLPLQPCAVITVT